jgi:thiosulfate/3-mercaptopyruvate sulfurtransferase
MNDPRTLVSTNWLALHLTSPDVRIVDGSFYLPDAGRDARAEYEKEHIQGAVFFDIDEIADETSPYPHMMPSAEKFSSRVRALGLGDGNRIVVYDGAGIFSAARVWWMFKAMGHDDVAVLDGGLPKWLRETRPVTDAPTNVRPRHFTPRPNHAALRDWSQVAEGLETGRETVVDVRSAERFAGNAPEPRPGVRRGHMPGAINLPYRELFGPDGTLLKGEALRTRIKEAGIDPRQHIVTSCGSGVTAAILLLALDTLGYRNLALYDGSWTEWGSREDLPVVTGA